jgi:hypothetical protein
MDQNVSFDFAESIVQRLRPPPYRSYALLANVAAIEPNEPFKICDDLWMRRASDAEIKELHHAIDIYYPHKFRNPYEVAVSGRERVSPNGETIHFADLPMDQWRYIVVADEAGGGRRTQTFMESSFFTPWPLELGFQAGCAGQAVGFGTLRGLDRILEHPEAEIRFLQLTTEQLLELARVFAAYSAYSHTILDLRRPIRQFAALLELDRRLEMRYMGLFAIVESLVTHDPKGSDPGDSITRQVTSKMELLNNRFPRPLPFADYFGQVSTDKVWKKLYGVRSALAHGGEPDFSGEYQALVSLEQALAFLQLGTSAVMRQALEEPQLIRDLRNC